MKLRRTSMLALLLAAGLMMTGPAAVSAAPASQAAKAKAKARTRAKAKTATPAPPADTTPYNMVTADSLRAAIEDLVKTFGDRYPQGPQYLRRLRTIQATGDKQALADLARQALLASPLFDFDRMLLVRRKANSFKLGLPQNWQGNCALRPTGYGNDIAVLDVRRPDAPLRTLYRPEKDVFVGDVDLHFDATRLLFSMPGSHDRWQIWEIGIDGKGLRQVTPGREPDVDNYDACYLPNGRIIFDSTACFQGVPCVGGSNAVANLFIMNADGTGIRQLCFDQDHDWNPVVLNNGRVLYSRWEYSDSPHYFTRLLFHMNPDGTEQREFYGSNSYWPNSIFYARPIPGSAGKVVAIISGHHGVARAGELVIFDPSRGRHEADGALQRIPGRGKNVNPTIADQLVGRSWPRFLHPYPLGDPKTGLGGGKYFLVACQPTPRSLWGLYLADVFDNLILIRQEPGYALLEPIPLRPVPTPPIIPDRVDPKRRDAVAYLTDVYAGPGLAGVPRGTIKKLRIYEQHYAYNRMGGHIHVGIDGPWDVKRILGTVPVEPDGSASFTVPANTPLSIQPLDQQGKAVQLFRSWFTAMPGEVVSCVGCHERQNTTSPNHYPQAMTRPPSTITPWYGPTRGFSFKREVQPVLDKYCVGCHDGSPGSAEPSLTVDGPAPPNGRKGFTPSYQALHRYVRRPGPESDYHILQPMEYYADTSELVQMLLKGHHGVQLDAEAWDRLITWIDLNVPDHGTWHETRPIPGNYHERRLAMRTRYANRPEDPEAIPDLPAKTVTFVRPQPPRLPKDRPACDGWPFDADAAAQRVQRTGLPAEQVIDLGQGVQMKLRLVPPGRFIMGGSAAQDEYPHTVVEIDRPFYIGQCEVTNAQFARFDPQHDSAYISVYNKDQSTRGLAVNQPDQPVLRVSWRQALAFCQWLSQRTGRPFTLPTEAQWEYACRAGTDSPLNFGSLQADFARHANLADTRLLALTRRDSPKWIPAVTSVNDGATVTQAVGRYKPNAWGLYDMHGNVAEWTLSKYRPYPYDEHDGRNALTGDEPRVVRGGSFYDRPYRAASGYRLFYRPFQKVYNVGFRVVCPAGPVVTADRSTPRR